MAQRRPLTPRAYCAPGRMLGSARNAATGRGLLRLKSLVVGTKNRDKFAEIEAILLGLPVRVLPLPPEIAEVVEDEPTLEGNADLKARAYARATGMAVLADDTGLHVDALGGNPGVRTARYAGPDATYAQNRRRLLDELRGVPPELRTARFRCVISLARPSGDVVARAEGLLEGVILEKEHGEAGFGYDPVFAVGGRTLADMPAAEKNAISHRARALVAIRPKILELL